MKIGDEVGFFLLMSIGLDGVEQSARSKECRKENEWLEDSLQQVPISSERTGLMCNANFSFKKFFQF